VETVKHIWKISFFKLSIQKLKQINTMNISETRLQEDACVFVA